MLRARLPARFTPLRVLLTPVTAFEVGEVVGVGGAVGIVVSVVLVCEHEVTTLAAAKRGI